ncbi:MAG: hypothetical protein ACK44A_11150 [Roseateles sp.]
MDLGQHISLGLASSRDVWSWLLLLSMAAKVGSTLILLAQRAGCSWRWASCHRAGLWWTTKLSALAVCASAVALCRLADDTLGERFFEALLLVAAALVAVRIWHRLNAA